MKCETAKALAIDGIVISFYFEEGSRGSKTFRILQNGVELNYNGGLDLNFVEPGDSIHKSSGEFRLEIYRENHLFKTIEGDKQSCQQMCD